MEQIAGNILIAEFMGGKLKYYSISNEPYYRMKDKTDWMPQRLVYHLSWDKLKPVIDEIFTYAIAYPEQVKVIRDISIVVEIGGCWQKVVDFIIWYNEHKINKK